MSNVGQLIYGFCNGYFGRDYSSPKRIEAEGVDWVVARTEKGAPVFASFDPGPNNSKQWFIDEWAKAEEMK